MPYDYVDVLIDIDARLVSQIELFLLTPDPKVQTHFFGLQTYLNNRRKHNKATRPTTNTNIYDSGIKQNAWLNSIFHHHHQQDFSPEYLHSTSEEAKDEHHSDLLPCSQRSRQAFQGSSPR
jgi:hypothetical protein